MFKNRQEAGRLLAEALSQRLKNLSSQNSVILAVPRGGIVIGYEISQRLGIKLFPLITKKIPFPGQEELAIGAVNEEGDYLLDQEMIQDYQIRKDYLDQTIETIKKEIKRRYQIFGQKRPSLKNKIVILTDDGIATGLSIRVGIKMVRKHQPKKIVLAIPVMPRETYFELQKEVDEIVCLETPLFFQAIGQFYLDFSQLGDEEVIELLKRSHGKRDEKRKGL